MTVKAPFRFARINRWIHEPAWGPLVSHDVPFVDGLSGQATVRITAKTPLLVGGRRRKAEGNSEGAVWPFRLPDGGWAIPPATLQGLSRSILEVAAFGRLGPWIEKRHFGIRDLTDTATARHHYRDFLRHTQAGWLVARDGKRWIVKCEYARLNHEELKVRTGLDFGNEDISLERRYEGVDRWRAGAGGRLHFQLRQGKVHKFAAPATSGIPGTVVVTGYVPRKKKEFVFHGPDQRDVQSSGALEAEVSDTVWDTFLYLHCDSNGKATHPAWEHWEDQYKDGEPIPVFWWADPEEPRKVATFGMAFAFKAGFALSTWDLLRHSHADHLKEPAEAALDLPHLIFGVAAEADKGRGLKRRAWFGLARAVGDRDAKLQSLGKEAILSNPKPGYLGLYVRQRPAEADEIPQGGSHGEPLAAYASVVAQGREINDRALDNLRRPELAGVKLWPSSRDRDRGIRISPPPEIKGVAAPGASVKAELSAVPSGTVFETTLIFHNLRPVELGALLWALSFGDAKAFGQAGEGPRLRHRLGMGKPFGLGEVEIAISDITIDDADGPSAEALLKAFEEHMEKVYPQRGASWKTSPQVEALVKAANPDANRAAELRYMGVTGPASYVENRKQGAFLGPYVQEDDEIAKPAPAPGSEGQPTRAVGSAAGGRARFGTHAAAGEPARGGGVLGQQLRFRKGQQVLIGGEVATLLADVTNASKPDDEVMVDFGDGPEPVMIKEIQGPAK